MAMRPTTSPLAEPSELAVTGAGADRDCTVYEQRRHHDGEGAPESRVSAATAPSGSFAASGSEANDNATIDRPKASPAASDR